jgi:hypothetical protein
MYIPIELIYEIYNNVLQKINKNYKFNLSLIQYIEAINERKEMKKFINQEIILKDKKTILLSLFFIVVISFFLTNTHTMFLTQGNISESEVLIRKYLSLAPIKACILYFIYGLFIVFLFKDKKELFNDIDKNIYSFKEVFFTKYLSFVSVVTLNTLIISIFKLMAYFVNSDIFSSYSIGASRVIMFFIIFTLVSITAGSLGFLSMFLIKNNFIAVVLLPMIEYSLFLLFGLFNLLISSYLWPIQWLLNKISTFLVDYFVFFIAFDWRIELQSLGMQLGSIVFFMASSILLMLLSYNAMKRIKGNIIERDYYFLWIKKVLSVILAFIGAFTVLVFLDLAVLLVMPQAFDKINLGINIFMFIISIIIYKMLNLKNIDNKLGEN